MKIGKRKIRLLNIKNIGYNSYWFFLGMEDLTGKKIDGHFNVIREVGSGGMAVVYLVRDEKLNRYRAIKILNRDKISNIEYEWAKKRFEKEAQNAANAGDVSQNIITIHHISELEGTPYFVMDYIEGVTLNNFSGISYQMAAKFLAPIAEALDSIHKKGMVHRDVTPGNIMIKKDGTPVLMDFGISINTDMADSTSSSGQTRQWGTTDYAAPELIFKREIDGRADEYSLCLIFYKLLTGENPNQDMKLLKSREIPSPVMDRVPDVPPLVDEIIQKALQYDPDDRYPDTGKMAEDLWKLANMDEGGIKSDSGFSRIVSDTAVETTGVIAAPDSRRELDSAVGDRAERTEHKRGNWFIIPILIVLVGIGFGIYYFQDGRRNNILILEEHTPTLQDLTEKIITETVLASEIPEETVDDLIVEDSEEPAVTQIYLTEVSLEAASVPVNVQVGDVITFGRYEQDNNMANGTEPVQWIVLKVENGQAMLLSKYGLDYQKYNTTDEEVTWETCTLRTWLKDEFLKNAFNEDERMYIQTTSVENPSNKEFLTDGGNRTEDLVFLLSFDEVDDLQYGVLSSKTNRLCEPTAATESKAFTNENGNVQWWLRSPGIDNKSAMSIGYGGGWVFSGSSVYISYVVRPAMWLDLSADGIVLPETDTITESQGVLL